MRTFQLLVEEDPKHKLKVHGLQARYDDFHAERFSLGGFGDLDAELLEPR